MHGKFHDKSNKGIYIALAILVILVLAFGGYILVDKLNESREQKDNVLREEGFNIGYEKATVDVLSAASTCQPFPVRYQNASLTLFALECNNLVEVANAALEQKAAAQEPTE